VNKKVGETIAAGLGKTEELAQSTKETMSTSLYAVPASWGLMVDENVPGKLKTHAAAEIAQQKAKGAVASASETLDQVGAKASQKKAELEVENDVQNGPRV
jgi:hypothetical protein